MPEWSIIVHGGAGMIRPGKEEACRRAILDALEHGVSVLKAGGAALDAVERAVRSMEDGGVFNAGRGSVARSDGEIEMEASIMDGHSLEIGAVAGVRRTQSPVSLARALLREKINLLTGPHADAFARERGFAMHEPLFKVPPSLSAQEAGHDTVGCIARDANGNIAAGLSTGGLSGAPPGRVGDAPLPGCGFYADNARGGVCFSGEGEKISRVMLAAEVIHEMRASSVQDAVARALLRIARVEGEAGCIAIGPGGEIGWSHNSAQFVVAFQSAGDPEPRAYLGKSESLLSGPHAEALVV